MVSKNLGDVERWQGLKLLKASHNPRHFSRKDKNGKHIPMHARAEAAASYLEEEIWGSNEGEEDTSADEIWDGSMYPIIINYLGIKLTDIEPEELQGVVEKAKRKKTAGLDDIPMEVFKELEPGTLAINKLLELLNDWWNNESITEDNLKARVVLIFKNGDTSGFTF